MVEFLVSGSKLEITSDTRKVARRNIWSWWDTRFHVWRHTLDRSTGTHEENQWSAQIRSHHDGMLVTLTQQLACRYIPEITNEHPQGCVLLVARRYSELYPSMACKVVTLSNAAIVSA